MKITKLKVYFQFIFLILSIQLRLSTIGVGFITINMEGGQFDPEEFIQLKQLLNYASTTETSYKILERIADAKTKDITLANLDFIMISIQESSTSVKDLSDFNSLLDPEEWVCQKPMIQTGWIKYNARSSTIVSLCNRKRFTEVVSIQENVHSFLTKYIGGYCYTLDDGNYCFLGGHFPVLIDAGAKLLNDVLSNTDLNGNSYYAYVAGDINTRALFDDNEKQRADVKSILEDDWKGRSFMNKKDWKIESKTDADNRTQEAFKSEFSLHSKSFLKFIGNEQMHQLPFTYKYDGKTYNQYNSAKIFDKKGFTSKEKRKVFNVGWLDRMLCVTSNEHEQSCKLAKKSNTALNNGLNVSSLNNSKDDQDFVKYFLVPFLKKGDHMPVLGYILINADLESPSKINHDISNGNKHKKQKKKFYK